MGSIAVCFQCMCPVVTMVNDEEDNEHEDKVCSDPK